MEYPDFISLHEEPETYSWGQVWIKALTKPDEETYERLVRDPKAGLVRAVSWILLSLLLQIPIRVLANYRSDLLALFDIVGNFTEQAPLFLRDSFFFLLDLFVCMPAGLIIQLILFILGTAIMHIIAVNLFQGEGQYNQLVYAIASFLTPGLVILEVIDPIPYVSYLALLLYIYLSYLAVFALKTIHRISWGKAVATYLIPLALLIIIVGFSIVGLSEGLFDIFGV
jgi:hypothetical protein